MSSSNAPGGGEGPSGFPPQDAPSPFIIKVLGLSRPELPSFLGHPFEVPELKDMCKADTIKEAILWDAGGDNEALGGLSLPKNTSLYLGQVFMAYVRICNITSGLVQGVEVKTELQTKSQRLVLNDSRTGDDVDPLTDSQSNEVPGNGFIDRVIRAELKELGTHILFCTVLFTLEGARQQFRRTFKVEVKNPLSLKTRVYAHGRTTYVEAQLQNVMDGPMRLTGVNLECGPEYTAYDLNTSQAATENDPMETYTQPSHVRQFIFKLVPNPELLIEAERAKHVGKLDITWVTTLGEPGHLQTSNLLKKKSLPVQALLLTVTDSPSFLPLETYGTVTFSITNLTDRKTSVKMNMARPNVYSGVVCAGTSHTYLGDLDPGQSLSHSLRVLLLQPGAQTLNGLRIVDEVTRTLSDFDNICTIMGVVPSPRL